MNRILVLACLALSTSAAASDATVYRVGRAAVTVPASLPATIETRPRAAVLDLEPRPGLSVAVFDYNWRNGPFYGLTADSYVKDALNGEGAVDFQVVEPPKAADFQGYPSTSFAIRHTMLPHHGKDRPVSFTERYLVVPRRWGFVVVRMLGETASDRDDARYFDQVVEGLRLAPEPPGSARLALRAALALLLLGAGAAAARFAKPRTPKAS